VVPVFSTSIFFLGASSAVAGRHIDRVGPRLFGIGSAVLWGSGHLIAAAGLHLHSLPLLYLGYGVFGGVGLGLGYLAPVGLLMSWFPERRGMATGMAIMGFGGGAIVFTPVMEAMIKKFSTLPTFVGPLDSVGQSMTADGVRHIAMDGQLVEVVASSAKTLSSFPGLQEGLYAVGTGSTGLGPTLACLGAGYFIVMAGAALSWRVPAPGWRPPPRVASARGQAFSAGPAPLVANSVTVDNAMRSPQFYYLWMNLFLNTSAGIGMIGVAKTMMGEIFGSALPAIVTPEFAASYVLAVSLANMGGRFFWATVSDYIGRKNAYYSYFCLGVPLYLSLPCWAIMTDSQPLAALALFYASTMVTFSTYGAGFATMPAYVADVFGPKNVSAIFGRVLTAWSAAGVLGPLAITQFRARAEWQAVTALAEQVGEERFLATFKAPVADLAMLTESKVVTMQKLLEIAPAGTLDPTPYMYNEVMIGMAGLQLLAIASNSRVRLLRPPPSDDERGTSAKIRARNSAFLAKHGRAKPRDSW
jgi:MFS family permease